MAICKNCEHKIRKTPKGWKHETGGTYCKASWTGNKYHLGGCLCNKAKPKK